MADHLIPEISTETVASLWTASEMHQSFKLKVAVHSFLAQNWTFSNLDQIQGIADVIRARPEYMCDLMTFVSLR